MVRLITTLRVDRRDRNHSGEPEQREVGDADPGMVSMSSRFRELGCLMIDGCSN